MEDKFIGYLLGSLDDDERPGRSTPYSPNIPRRCAHLEVLRQALEPLAADRDTIDPPADLVVRTIARVAEHIVETEGSVAPSSPGSPVAEFLRTLGRREASPVYPWHGSEANPAQYRRRDVATVFGLAAALMMVALTGVMTLRQTRDVQACQNHMRVVYQGLNDYASIHGDRYPQVADKREVGTGLWSKFQKTQTMPSEIAFACPAVRHQSGLPVIDYAYHLGYRDEQGKLQGLSHQMDNDQFPILADAPKRIDDHNTIPINHRKGQNVLFAGGQVRFCTNPFVGPEIGGKGDDIYYNTVYQRSQSGHQSLRRRAWTFATNRPDIFVMH